jgi:hypothetical protein
VILQIRSRTSGFAHQITQDFKLDEYKNLFNLSLCVLQNELGYVAAIRALSPEGILPFRSSLLTMHNGQKSVIDLTDAFLKYDVEVVADPKLFAVEQTIWCTFNTGYKSDVANDIYLVQVFPFVGKPQRCIYIERQRIEKNWAFYRKDDSWYALYGLSPVKILKCNNDNDESELVFETVAEHPKKFFKDYSIGTQICTVDERSILVAHKKINIGEKRIYLGRILIIDLQNETIRPAKTAYLIHSFKSLFGVKQKWNKNLISCTYFSGITYEKTLKKLYLGYGVNDLNYNIAEIEESEL